jgi:hypothetical protein
VKDFLSFFSVTLGVEGVEGLEALLSGRSYARSITPIVDPKTFNLKFDTRGSILSSFGSQWVRDIARSIVLQVPQVSEPINSEELTSEHLQNAKLWVASPEVCGRLKEVDPSIYTLPLEGVPTVGFHEYAGTILINPNSIECEGREIHERWEIYGSVDFKVWLNPTVPLDIRGARSKDISVELVQ